MRIPDGATYHLGHNETMQVSIALGVVNDWLRDGTNRLNDVDMQHVTREVIADMLGIFGTGGPVTVSKNFEDPAQEVDASDLPRFRDRFTDEEWARRQAETAAAVDDEHSHGGTPTLDDGC